MHAASRQGNTLPVTMMNFFDSYQLQVKFLDQPPEDLRKSNFFKFTIELRAGNETVHIERAMFEKFLHENENDTRNGIMYSARVKYLDGREETRCLYLTLVDASSYEPIRYEGHDDSPKMQRVLLTHEAICTRCSQQKSCGNKSEAPSDPRIVDRGILQFFLKCNQNCLKGAGNPRDMRRFALAISFEDVSFNKSKIAALSNKIFVHNNSKHSRKRKKEVEIKTEIQPLLDLDDSTYIFPKVGIIDSCFSFHSKQWCKSGVSFKSSGMDLLITSVIYNVAMTVQLPPNLRPGRIFLTLCIHNSPVFTFPYEIQPKFYAEMRAWTNGFLVLRNRDDPNAFEAHPGPDNAVVYVIEGSQYPSCYYQNGAYPQHPPFNYAPHPNYPHNSPSSLSPNGSLVSGSSESPPAYIPQGY